MIYEAVDRETGEVWAAFRLDEGKRSLAETNRAAGALLRFELVAAGLNPDDYRLRPANAPYPNIQTAAFNWLPRESCRYG